MSRISDLEGLELAVYSATWCPDCRRLEAWLAEHQVAHTKVDIERRHSTQPAASTRASGAMASRPLSRKWRSCWRRGSNPPRLRA